MLSTLSTLTLRILEASNEAIGGRVCVMVHSLLLPSNVT
jgi:hypothetical protein